MLLALIIGAVVVVAIICSCAMLVKYLREDADDDGNSKPSAGVNRCAHRSPRCKALSRVA
jgi:hypothetical protein